MTAPRRSLPVRAGHLARTPAAEATVPAVTPADLAIWLGGRPGPLVLDVRRPAAFAGADSILPGARWFDPSRVADWCVRMPAGRRLVAYCVHGHEVGRSVVAALRRRGFEAWFLEGGIEGWKKVGGAVRAKRESGDGRGSMP